MVMNFNDWQHHLFESDIIFGHFDIKAAWLWNFVKVYRNILFEIMFKLHIVGLAVLLQFSLSLQKSVFNWQEKEQMTWKITE